MQKLPRKALTSALALVVSLCVGLALTSCSNDGCPICPTCEEPKIHNDLYDGRLYVAAWNENESYDNPYACIYAFDCSSDSLVDSIVYYPLNGASDPSALLLSEDGHFLAVQHNGGAAHVYDAATLTELSYSAHLEGVFQCFTGEGRFLLADYRGEMRFYTVPELQLVHSDSVGVGKYVRSRDATFCIPDDKLGLYEYSLSDFQVSHVWQPRGRDGVRYKLSRIDLSDDGQLLYAIAMKDLDGASALFVCYDLVADSVISEYPLWVPDVVCTNPIRGEVYVLGFSDPWRRTPGNIWVFDAATGVFLESVSLWGHDRNWYEQMTGRGLAVTPDGNQLYVATYALAYTELNPSTVLRIDTRTKRIESLLFPDMHPELYIIPWLMTLGPKP